MAAEPTTPTADPCEDNPYPKGGVFGTLTSAVIECADFPRIERFYREVIGLPVTLSGEGWSVLGRAPGEIVLWQGDKSELVPGFMGAEIEPALTAARERGAEPSTVYQHPGGSHFYVLDPDGNPVQIGDK
jgi:catechol 2,3-dioxygenase-like lactoylglutathione lyase family enzyme